MESPLVSIIVPAYNTESYLGRCLESLAGQTYSNLEILVIDDGSTDGTYSICEAYAKKDSRFRIFHKENSGVSDSRNLGLEKARGTYLVFADSDDYVKPDYVQTLVTAAEGAQLVCGEFFFVEDGVERKHPSILQETEIRKMTARDAIDLLPNKQTFQGYICSKLFVTEILNREGLRFDPTVKIWEDMLFCLLYLTKIQSVAYVGKPIYDYVQRDSSAMASKAVLGEYTQITALEKMWEIARPMTGAFHDFVRDNLAFQLVAALGKPKFREEAEVRQMLKTVNGLKARLPIRHRVKKLLFQWGVLPRKGTRESQNGGEANG